MREIHLSHSKADNFNSFLFRLEKKKTETKEKRHIVYLKDQEITVAEMRNKKDVTGMVEAVGGTARKSPQTLPSKLFAKTYLAGVRFFRFFYSPPLPSPPLPSFRYLSHFPFFFLFFRSSVKNSFCIYVRYFDSYFLLLCFSELSKQNSCILFSLY